MANFKTKKLEDGHIITYPNGGFLTQHVFDTKEEADKCLELWVADFIPSFFVWYSLFYISTTNDQSLVYLVD